MNDSASSRQSVVDSLIAAYQPRFALCADFYASEQVYRTDLEKIFFRSWIYAGHVSQLPESGCYFLVEFDRESVIVVRGGDGEIRGFANVCRHRGSRICQQAQGKVRAFVCPYHAWTYELDGSLRSKRAMHADFDQAGYGLKPVRVGIFHGLVFVNLDPNAPELNASLAPIDASFDIYDLEHTKVACQETYSVDANWKLTIENFMECYHCAPAHTEYSRVHALKSPKDNAALRPAMLEDAARLDYQVDTVNNAFPKTAGEMPYYYNRNALYDPHVTGSRSGQAVAPLLGGVKAYGGGVADTQFGPVSHGILYPDHAVIYRFLPRAAQRTDMDIIWLVRADAEDGKDYDIDELTWMWRVTTEADKQIILDNQRGVNSRFYEPGPLSEMETMTTGFIEWYLAQIQ